MVTFDTRSKGKMERFALEKLNWGDPTHQSLDWGEIAQFLSVRVLVHIKSEAFHYSMNWSRNQTIKFCTTHMFLY